MPSPEEFEELGIGEGFDLNATDGQGRLAITTVNWVMISGLECAQCALYTLDSQSFVRVCRLFVRGIGGNNTGGGRRGSEALGICVACLTVRLRTTGFWACGIDLCI